MKNLIIATFLVMISLIGCKEEKVFPSETQTGLNTFGVKINGKIWIPERGVSILGSPEEIVAGYMNGVFAITARKGINDEVIVLLVDDLTSAGTYVLKEYNNMTMNGTRYDGKYVDDDYFPYSGGINKINVTKLDTVNKIVSGNFEIQLKGKDKNQVLNFTKGVFDVTY